MRLAFLGTPETSVVTLEALIGDGHDIAIAVTQADKKRGRGGALVPSPIGAAAAAAGIPVTSKVDDVLALDPPVELGVVVAFGKLIKPHVLEKVRMINIHFSLLPRWRGAAPVERAILAGDVETGVCIMAIDEGLDTGPVYDCHDIPIAPEETADELRARLASVGTEMLRGRLTEGLGVAVPQSGEPTYAAKMEPEELHLDWSQPAEQLHRVVRLGRAWTTFRDKRLRILRATVADGPAPSAPGEIDGLVV